MTSNGPMRDAIANLCKSASEAQRSLNEHRMACLECAAGSKTQGYSWKDCEIGKALYYMVSATESSFRDLVIKAYELTDPPEGRKTNPADVWQETVVSGAVALPPASAAPNGTVRA